jgi:hypothetical protein
MNQTGFCLMCVALVPAAATADDPVSEIISAWHEATANITSVQGSFRVIRYNDTFRVVEHGKGTFGYLSPQHGFWRITNDDAEHNPHHDARTGVPYRVSSFKDVHLRWHAGRLREINEEEKSFIEVKIDLNPKLFDPKASVRFFDVNRFRTVDSISPFLPGCPNKETSDHWTYSITKQSDSHTWVRAVPLPDTPASQSFASSDIYFQNAPVVLLATRTRPQKIASQTVIIYSDVTFDPEPWPEPELSEYKKY